MTLNNDMALVKSCSDSLHQVTSIIQLCGDLYHDNGKVPASPIGKHVRHVLDHFLVLEKGLQSGEFDYNYRRRDNDIEQSADIALDEIDHYLSWLEQISQQLKQRNGLDDSSVNFTTEQKFAYLKQPVKLISEVDFDEEKNVTMTSCFFREVLYVINHTIHHVAFMSLALKVHGIHVPDNIGLASATASYQRKQAQTA